MRHLRSDRSNHPPRRSTMMSRRYLPVVVAPLVFASLIAASSPARSDEAGARSFITQLGTQAQGILQPSVTPDKRRAAIEGLLRRAFDFGALARSVAGRFWNQATPQQQADYQQAFADYIARRVGRQLANETMSEFRITGTIEMSNHD